MIKTVCLFEKTFEKYEEQETSFTIDLGDDVSDCVDFIVCQKDGYYATAFL